MSDLPKECFVVGNKLMMQCADCGKIVRVDKPIFGGLHFCLTDEERQMKYQQQNQEVKAKS